MGCVKGEFTSLRMHLARQTDRPCKTIILCKSASEFDKLTPTLHIIAD